MENIARFAVRRAPFVVLLWLAVIVGLNDGLPPVV
jgi:hypothetical protein